VKPDVNPDDLVKIKLDVVVVPMLVNVVPVALSQYTVYRVRALPPLLEGASQLNLI
jgi:hypothetical protein